MTGRGGWARWVALLAFCIGLSACASLPFFGAKNEAAQAAAPGAGPEVAVYRVEVVVAGGAADLRLLLSTYLDLARFQNAPATDAITASELDRLIAAAPAQVQSLLDTEGYFNPEVSVARVEPTGSAAVPLVRVAVTPGPRALVLKLALDATGALKTGTDATSTATLAALRSQWALQPGQPFRQSAWSGAKNSALAQVRANGYPAAQWQRTAATVDAAANSVALDLLLDSGALFSMGPLRVEGLQRYGADTVQQLSTFGTGTRYSEQLLLDFQERLQTSGLFEGASVELDLDAASAAAAATSEAASAPVLVRVRELPLQQATVGVGFSANTGARLTLEHVHRQPFGLKWIAKNKFELGPELKSWTGDLTSYPLEGQYRNLIGGGAERLRSADEVRSSWNARVGRTQDTPRIERLYYAEYTHVQLQTTGLPENNDAASLNYHWVWRDVDNVLLPTRGTTVSAQAAAGYAFSDTAANGGFGRAYGRLTWYRPVGDAWYATLRAEAGQVFARANVGVPDTILFRAGGDDSVRGYGYRTLGPTDAGTLVSGRVLFTGSAEIARPISPKRPEFLWAAFIDAGNAADRWGDLSPAVGVGVGVRWRSPVGPLKLDLAYGERARAVRVHFSVGIAY